ncbi:amidohydrolase family protein [Burkholderia cepacia]|uniref:amidohydrolase family protein n=1 Tax=Burkholderia cepacia TaxID=292 RepID=UPI0008412747|nr:amidohydrolase family protein [Burkholderia cepacia]AOI86014.1 hypothetical protein WI67_26780 [Burkholderia cepacia]
MISRRSFNRALGGFAMAGVLGGCAGAAPGRRTITGVDTHAHVFLKSLPLVPGHRYTIAYDASLDQYLAMLDRHGMSNGVLIQPSFLGTDNRYLLAALRAEPARLRGIVVIDPARDAEQVAAWTPLGVRGIRLNLIGERDPDFSSPAWRALLPLLRQHGWQVELHAEAAHLTALMPPLLDAGVDVSLDHFGRPDPRLGIDDPGFRYLLTTAASKHVWVKVSGAYRNDRADRWQASGLTAMHALREAFGTERLLWGSDWPHVGYEAAVDDALAYRYMETLLPDQAGRRQVLVDTPSAFYGFDRNA